MLLREAKRILKRAGYRITESSDFDTETTYIRQLVRAFPESDGWDIQNEDDPNEFSMTLANIDGSDKDIEITLRAGHVLVEVSEDGGSALIDSKRCGTAEEAIRVIKRLIRAIKNGEYDY